MYGCTRGGHVFELEVRRNTFRTVRGYRTPERWLVPSSLSRFAPLSMLAKHYSESAFLITDSTSNRVTTRYDSEKMSSVDLLMYIIISRQSPQVMEHEQIFNTFIIISAKLGLTTLTITWCGYQIENLTEIVPLITNNQ